MQDSGKMSGLITAVLEKKLSIQGSFKQPTLPTGTWAYWYVIDEKEAKIEITNENVRDSLMTLEGLVGNL